MKIFSQKEKNLEPQYYVSATNAPTYNYRVYYMNTVEKIMYFALAFIVGAAVGYLFYGGIGKDEYGDPTTLTWILNITTSAIAGIAAGILYLPIRTKQIQKKKQNDLRLQFREMLDALSTSIGSGKNVVESIRGAYEDLRIIYPNDASIVQELAIILDGVNNNIDLERLLLDFGCRSGVDDIESFANVFETCYRKGGNIKEVIRNTQQIITEKMEVKMEIDTIVTSSKNEQMIMTVLPIALIGIIKLMSPEFANNFATPAGIASTTIAVILFVAAYFVGKKILEIRI